MDGPSQQSETPQAPRAFQAQPDYAQGRTIISDTAVAKVVGVAARGVEGVHALGSGASRSIGAIRDVVGATDLTQGVRVEVGESQVAVDLVMMALYGYPLQNLANTVRAAVYAAVEELVGRDVIEVNIEITDVFIPSADADKQQSRPKLADRYGAAGKPATVATNHGGQP
ncbi:Asp23/Gls24 family envelope stress response protein [Arthrobacter livingstonensis]|uniref:Asp23/Gls24 family envelope stress response protein n=1 Tax=Arthrobacter livingstonensis TaxID=670078 RepID=A0A2V5L252_9MICC|nr:Asp23/Gls24 family envelope stress response protein [Arthrobacter livingstonensis]PYI65411.1 Asp23/Gls24 family envelope stress response protein [Arthrobacter livingstonensis]